MKTIYEHGTAPLTPDFDLLRPGDRFLYKTPLFEFFAFKINSDYAAFLNGYGQFIVAKRYKNCLSIGSGRVKEFNSLAEAKDYALTKPEI